MTTYVALIHGRPGAFGISLPDLPGCTSGGATIDEALAHARQAVTDWLEGMIHDGHPIPPPRPLDSLKADPEYADDFDDVVLVTAVDIEAAASSGLRGDPVVS